MDKFIRAVRLVSQLCGYAAAALIAVSVVIVCDMVFVRYVLNESTIWQTDFVTYSIVAATFVGSPYVLMVRGHVNVDLLPLYLGARARYWLALACGLIALAFCVAAAVLTFRFWHEAWTEGWRSDTMWRVRLWIPYGAMPVGLALLSLQYAVDLYCVATGRKRPFGFEDEK